MVENHPQLHNALLGINLTEGECQVYEALLELGLSSTGSITKKAGISSSKVYEVLERLHKKGLVSVSLKNGVRNYDATPPERLIDFLEERKDALSIAQKDIRSLLPMFKGIRKHAEEENKTIVYTGLQGPKIALSEILEAGKNGISCCGFGTHTDPYVQFLPHVLNRYIQESKKYHFKTRLLFQRGFKSPNTAAQVRYLPKEYLFPVRIMVYGTKVAIVDFTKPVTTIIIDKKEIAASFHTHFDLLWRLAKP